MGMMKSDAWLVFLIAGVMTAGVALPTPVEVAGRL